MKLSVQSVDSTEYVANIYKRWMVIVVDENERVFSKRFSLDAYSNPLSGRK